MLTHQAYDIYPCGDHAVAISFGEKITAAVNERVTALFHALSVDRLLCVADIIPAYATVTIVFDLPALQKQYPGRLPVQVAQPWLAQKMQILTSAHAVARAVMVPVCYHPSLAPDLFALAEMHGLAPEEIVQLHTGKTYRVYMIGFLPGFAYMGPVDERLITPRKTTPRKKIPAGSVGIAGAQTGIYPFDSPGGWQLIGQTPIRLFDTSRQEPCYFQPGDEVRFYSIGLEQFDQMKKQ